MEVGVMFARGIALCSIFALATVAQGGVQVSLVPAFCPGGGTCIAGLCSGGTRNGLACAPLEYPPSAVVQVDVKLAQAPGGSDQLLRMIELDMLASSALLTYALPLTHDKGTPGTGDDLYFWSFSSLANCVSTASFCGFKHFVDFSLTAGPVDTRLKILSIAFFGQSADGSAQILLPASGAPVTVGKLQVTTAAVAGTYTLNMVNAADTGNDRGARVDFGFDPHYIWRARNPDNGNCSGVQQPFACCTGLGTGNCPNNVTGGTLAFAVCNVSPGQLCPTLGPSVLTWESVITHVRAGVAAIDVPLNIPVPVPPDTGSFSEPRSGVKKLVVTFDLALNPATAIPSNVTVCGNNSAGSPVDLSGVTITAGTVAGSGDMKMEINFAPAVPDYARYKIALKTTILGAGGGAIQAGNGGLTRILVALQGDANGSRNVSATDLGAVRPLIPTDPIDPAVLNQVRFDVNNSKHINATDLGLIRGKVGNDARTIPDPVCP